MSLNFYVAERANPSSWPLGLLRWALILIFVWFGCMKFTLYEAKGIATLVQHSPIIGWLYTSFGIQGASEVIGSLELLIAICLALGAFIAAFSALGAAMSCVTFLMTLSFMLSTPGVWAVELGGFPALSGDIGEFLIKDIVLLAASACLLFNSFAVASQRSPAAAH